MRGKSVGVCLVAVTGAETVWILTMDPSAQVIFKRKGTTKPIQRARERSPENVDTSEASALDIAEDSPSILATKLKKKIQKSRPKSRLSFGVEDDEVCLYHLKFFQADLWC